MRNRWLKSLVPALALATLPVLPAVSQAGIAVGVSITVAPPALPVYVQPPLPAPGYIWSPGYWAYGDDGYYWVPGTWVLPPEPGLLWTPGYWGWVGGSYIWHVGYWGPHVGFYGGVNYGCGYTGVGFQGGYWHGGAFFYNRSVMNVGSVHVTNVYNRTVINVNNHVSFNGPGGVMARATPHELAAEHERHFEATSMQRQHQNLAMGNRELHASFNHGAPPVAATSRPGQFSGRGVVAARGFSGPHGGPVGGGQAGGFHGGPAGGQHGGPGPVAHNAGPENRGFENHGGGAGPGFRGGAPAAGAPGGGHTDIAHNNGGGFAARGGQATGGHPAFAHNNGGGFAPRGSQPPGGGFAPRGGQPGGGHPDFARNAGGMNGGMPHQGGPAGGAPHFNAPPPRPAGNFGGGRPQPQFGGGGRPAPAPQNHGGGGGGRRPEGHR